MADFCKECSTQMFGEDMGDLAGLCEPEYKVVVICEGCGFITVDHLGVRVDADPKFPNGMGHP